MLELGTAVITKEEIAHNLQELGIEVGAVNKVDDLLLDIRTEFDASW